MPLEHGVWKEIKYEKLLVYLIIIDAHFIVSLFYSVVLELTFPKKSIVQN